ncbi:M24 family metallopeptidase [Emticicia sp. CRIBPO]|uniref:aminopeptidase P N-terminal domain-containing protein n=1 Tax=Emticicia sp. CRIBPO TaxID=2683258 RepID=UPI001412AABC|nr:aminopeptidase P N-terminal domain-containing protein [Emticicia sp. CRIBPO]NBA84617.1 M24 family metallopeptidase [Emticicia sp. CRIBPO]
MRYEKISPELFIQNRQRLIQKLKPQSVAIFCSNDPMPANADGTMGFIQNSNLFYLTGIDQEETFLVINPSHPDPEMREVLFVRETSEHIRIWEGEKLTKEEAREISGIRTVYWSSQFESVVYRLIPANERIYLNLNEHDGADISFETRERKLLKELKEKFPLHNYDRSAPLLQKLREVKSKHEIELLKKAIDITGKAFRRLTRFIGPGVFEYQLEAEMTHEFLMNRSRGHAFQPILASGENACVLHYVTNNNFCKSGDLILMDFGAEYANYKADITRTVPVSGKFTERQKAVYQAVLNVLYASRKLIVPGNTLVQLKEQANELMKEELLKLGLITPENPQVKKYFPHGISHFLGLDVHDVGDKYAIFKPGMVFTCEPGIYIPEEGLGIRLENDILVTENGNIDLMEGIPLEIEEIERMMND